MKKLVKLMTLILCICSVFTFASCNEKTEKAEKVSKTETSSAVENSSDENSEKTVDLTDSIPEMSTFQTVPDDAEKPFDNVIEQSKEDFKDVKGKKYYGYQGKQKINNVECHLFVVYSEKDDTYTKLATYASVIKNGDIYKLNEETNKFEKCIVSEKTKELSWADTETESFAKYLSANKENDTQSTENSSEVSSSKAK